MSSAKLPLAGWGLYPTAECLVERPERYQQLKAPITPTIARGLGRSYGDATLNQGRPVILMERLNRFLSFDPKTGVLQAEAGISVADILKVFVPRGWFLPVMPGTKYVTLGGCVACDVHGKNHPFAGSFTRHVHKIELLMADGTFRRCSPVQDSELFWATAGGMGLTGIITAVELQLIPISSSFMRNYQCPAKDLEETFRLIEEHDGQHQYMVAWQDISLGSKKIGRSLIFWGDHAARGDLPSDISDPLQIPPYKSSTLLSKCPSWVLNRYSISLYNAWYLYRHSNKPVPTLLDYESFFYPLDYHSSWNKLYGKKGFVQYHFVIPSPHGYKTIKRILEKIAQEKRPSYLSVLKKFGEQGQGLLSFPKLGYSLCLDFPCTDPSLFTFLDTLDEIVLNNEGRLYLAKDARMSPSTFRGMYPRHSEWQKIKNLADPHYLFSSDLSKRLRMEASP